MSKGNSKCVDTFSYHFVAPCISIFQKAIRGFECYAEISILKGKFLTCFYFKNKCNTCLLHTVSKREKIEKLMQGIHNLLIVDILIYYFHLIYLYFLLH